ncbi:MAG: hypothetical protein GXP15_12770 [Gammaproteobacteria bacterium]|nr:hypothetical protein [Gammaproteobacteria bacterium]
MTGKITQLFIFQLLIALTLSGCATVSGGTGDESEVRADANFQGTDCILIRTIRDYRPLDKSHLLISSSSKRSYFVTLFWPAYELRHSTSLRFESRDSQLCPYGGDAIIFGTFSQESVSIRAISRVTEEEKLELLVQYGIIERAEQKPPEPAIVKGAEVEEQD